MLLAGERIGRWGTGGRYTESVQIFKESYAGWPNNKAPQQPEGHSGVTEEG
jgi:hypothetical protein